MSLRHIIVTDVRNLRSVTITPSSRINILYGNNGSGKTSLLEAIHLLGIARSFRSNKLLSIIRYDQSDYSVFGKVQLLDKSTTELGISRNRDGKVSIRIDGESIHSASILARKLPLQLINSDSFDLLEGSPKNRRNFIDWGVFHVEQNFFSEWQNMQKSLKQRNSILRHGTIDKISLAVWSKEFCNAARKIDKLRENYIETFIPVFKKVLKKLIDIENLTLNYYRGWGHDKDLFNILDEALYRDKQVGYTQAGPQRADLKFRIGTHNASEVLSRGQQKLVVCALRITQGMLINEDVLSKKRKCIYLIDDLPSELDEVHRNVLCQLLEELQCQVFITCVDYKSLKESWKEETPLAMFHVEQGNVVRHP
ncbi:UNVERIFIED_CONTAM: hypothetical protein GTU68_008220 [Idotea baltica]|nr:hypothetical protein [Idotea baltica]